MVFPVLNLIQTIPSIALFGLFMAPLAWLAASYPPLARAGISGVGLAPAVLALVLYSLLPVVRSGLAGLEQVPNATRSAARAMGMSGWQVFRMVELPLALPMVLPGLRTAVVQAIGLTAVTALIGAGGLGTLMFDGLFSAANELVLLGVLPIVLLAALADALFDTMGVWVRPVGVSEQGANG
jgi:osmoprotectant transport system permease protein